MLKVHVVYLLYRLSSCGVCLDTISQPNRLPEYTVTRAWSVNGGGEHIYICVLFISLSLSLCLSPCIHPSIDIYRRIARLAPPIPAAMSGTSSESSASEILPEKKVCKAYDIMVLGFRARVYYEA